MVSKISGIFFYLLPALRICGIEVPVFAACHGRTATAERQQFAFTALFKFFVFTVLLHFANPHISQPVRKNISDLAVLYTAAGINISRRKNRQVAVAAVAAAVNHTVLYGFGDFERPGFVFVQCPQVVFFIEISLTAFGFVFLEFLVAVREQFAVTHWLDAYILFPTCRAVTGERKDIHTRRHNSVNNTGNLVNVGAGNGGHYYGANARTIDAADFIQRNIKAAGLAEPVVSFTQTVNGKLIFFTTVFF